MAQSETIDGGRSPRRYLCTAVCCKRGRGHGLRQSVCFEELDAAREEASVRTKRSAVAKWYKYACEDVNVTHEHCDGGARDTSQAF